MQFCGWEWNTYPTAHHCSLPPSWSPLPGPCWQASRSARGLREGPVVVIERKGLHWKGIHGHRGSTATALSPT